MEHFNSVQIWNNDTLRNYIRMGCIKSIYILDWVDRVLAIQQKYKLTSIIIQKTHTHSMHNLNLFENLEDSGNEAVVPRLFDFLSFQPQADNSLNLFQEQLLQQPISPPIFQFREPPQLSQTIATFPPMPMQIVNAPESQPIQFVPYSFIASPNLNLSLNLSNFQPRFQPKKNKFIRRINLKTVKISGTRQCPICLEDMKKNSKIPHLPCKHEFHKKCLTDWIRKKQEEEIEQTCPCCRVEICYDS